MKTLVLDSTNKSITIELSASATTLNPDFTSHWADDSTNAFVEGSTGGILNHTTPVVVVDSPTASVRRVIKEITLNNCDTAPITAIVKYVDSSTGRVLYKIALQVNETWTLDATYQVDGSIKSGIPIGIHNGLSGIQGGSVSLNQFYHLTQAQHAIVDSLTGLSGVTSVHNSLIGLQGGASALDQYYHLPLTAYSIALQSASSDKNGYLTSGDWNYFYSITSTISSQINSITSLSGAVTGQTANIDSLSSSVTSLSATVTSLSASLTSITGSHAAVTLSNSANGLSLSGQELSLALASSSTTGSLTNTDWSTFNGKQDSFDLSGLSSTVTANSQNISSLSSTVTGLQSATGTLTSQIDSLSSSITSYSSDISSLSSSVTSLSSTVTGFTTQINSLSSSVTSLSASVTSLQTATGSLTTQINSLSSTVTGNSLDISALSSTVTGHTQDIQTLSAAITSSTGTHAPVTIGVANGLTLNIQELSMALASSTSTATGTITNAEFNTFNSITSVSADLYSLSSTVTGQTNQITTLSGSITSLSGTVTGFTSQIDSLSSTVTGYGSQITTLSSSITSLSSTVTGFTSQINDLSGSVTSLSSTVTGFTSQIDSLSSSVTSLSSTVTGYSSQISDLSGSVTSLSGTVTGYTDQINSLSSTVTGYGSQISSLSSSVTSLSATVTGYTDQINALSSTVTGHTIQISALSGIVTQPTQNVMYAGTNGGGIFKSTNGGVNWSAFNTGLANLYAYALTANTSGDVFLGVGSGKKVYKNSNNAASWTLSNTGLDDLAVVWNFCISGSIIWAAIDSLGGRCYKSTNNGASWAASNSGLPTNYDVFAIALMGNDLYAGTYGAGIYKSTNGGASWISSSAGMSSLQVYSLFVDGTTIYAGTTNHIERSSDSGANWTTVYTSVSNNDYMDFAKIGTTLFSCATNDIGVVRSTDGGNTWTQCSTGLPTSASAPAVNALAVSGTDLFAGESTWGVFKSTNLGDSWTALTSGMTNTQIRKLLVVLDVGTTSLITSLSSNLTTVSGQVSTLSSSVTSLSASLSSLSAKVISLSASVTSLSGTVTGHTVQITALSGSVTSLSGTVTGFTSQINSLSSTVTGYGSQITALSSSVTSLSSTVTGFTSQINDLSGSVTSLSASLTATGISGSGVPTFIALFDSSSTLTASSIMSESAEDISISGNICLSGAYFKSTSVDGVPYIVQTNQLPDEEGYFAISPNGSPTRRNKSTFLVYHNDVLATSGYINGEWLEIVAGSPCYDIDDFLISVNAFGTGTKRNLCLGAMSTTGAAQVAMTIHGNVDEVYTEFNKGISANTLSAKTIYENEPVVFKGVEVKLISPYTVKNNSYRGQLHCHTTNSDGVSSSTAVVEFYRDLGYDFIAITDHDFVTQDPGVTGILFLQGIEQEVENLHTNRINSVVASSSTSATTVQKLLDEANISGDFVYLNHPLWENDHWLLPKIQSLDGYYGMEVWNALVTKKDASTKINQVLNSHRKTYLLSGDDLHNPALSWAGSACVYVFANTCTAPEIMDNLKAGNFYSSNGAVIDSIIVSGKTITINTPTSGTIEFIGNSGSSSSVIILQTSASTDTASYTVSGSELYVRGRVIRNSDSLTAWTNPIYVLDNTKIYSNRVYRDRLHINDPSLDHLRLANRFSFIGNSSLDLTNNAYYDNGYKYLESDKASKLTLSSNSNLIYSSAVSGTATSAVTFTDVLTVSANGNVTATRFYVSSATPIAANELASKSYVDSITGGSGVTGIAGSGTVGTIPVFSASSSLSSSIIFQNGTKIGIDGNLTADSICSTSATILANAYRFYAGSRDGSSAFGDFRTNPDTGNTIISAKLAAIFFNYDHGASGTFWANGSQACYAYMSKTGQLSLGKQIAGDIPPSIRNTIDAAGGVVIGSTYANLSAAPTNGLLTEGAVRIRGYSGGTLKSAISSFEENLTIGGAYNQDYNSGSAVLIHLADYSNDTGDAVYPIYVENENNNVDFYIFSGTSNSAFGSYIYFGGKTGIGTKTGSEMFNVSGNAFILGTVTGIRFYALSAIPLSANELVTKSYVDFQTSSGAVTAQIVSLSSSVTSLSATVTAALTAMGIVGSGAANYIAIFDSSSTLTASSIMSETGNSILLSSSMPALEFLTNSSTGKGRILAAATDWFGWAQNMYYPGGAYWLMDDSNKTAWMHFVLTTPGANDVYRIYHSPSGSLTASLQNYLTLEGTSGTLQITNGLTANSITSKKGVEIREIPDSDHTYSGITLPLTAHTDMGFGDVCFINSDGRAQLINSTAISTMNGICMAVDTIAASAVGLFMMQGVARDDTWNWNVGGLIYGATAGTSGNTLIQTPTTGTNYVIQILGVATHADRMIFNPQLVQVEHI